MAPDDGVEVPRRTSDFITHDRLELMEQRLTASLREAVTTISAKVDTLAQQTDFMDRQLATRQEGQALQIQQVVTELEKQRISVETAFKERDLAIAGNRRLVFQ